MADTRVPAGLTPVEGLTPINNQAPVGGLTPIEGTEESYLERKRKGLLGGMMQVLYGAAHGIQSGAENWLNPTTEQISGISEDDVIRMYSDTPRAAEARQQSEDRLASRAEASEGATERLERYAEKLAPYNVENPGLLDKLVAGAGSMAALLPIGAAAALTRNPSLAIGIPAVAEAMSEMGSTQMEAAAHGADPLDAAQGTRWMLPAGVATVGALPGVFGVTGRMAGRAASTARNAAEEGLQEGVQYLTGTAGTAGTTDKSFGELYSTRELAENIGIGAALGGLVGGAADVGGSTSSAINKIRESKKDKKAREETERREAQERILQEMTEKAEIERRAELARLGTGPVKPRVQDEYGRPRHPRGRQDVDPLGMPLRKDPAEAEMEQRRAYGGLGVDPTKRPVQGVNRPRGTPDAGAYNEAVGFPQQEDPAATEMEQRRAWGGLGVDPRRAPRPQDRARSRSGGRRKGPVSIFGRVQRAVPPKVKEEVSGVVSRGLADAKAIGEEAALDGVSEVEAEARVVAALESAHNTAVHKLMDEGFTEDQAHDAVRDIFEQQERGTDGDLYAGSMLGGLQKFLEGASVRFAPATVDLPDYTPPPGNRVAEATSVFGQTGRVEDFADRAVDIELPADFQIGEDWLDVPGVAYEFGGRKNVNAAIGQGLLDNPIDRHVTQMNMETELAGNNWLAQLQREYLELTRGMSKEQREDLGKRMEKEEHAGDFDVQAMRAWFDKVLEKVNYARKARGDRQIEKRKNYIPHIRHLSRLERIIGTAEHNTKGEVSLPAEEFFNAFAQHRSGETTDYTYDIEELARAYAQSAMKDIFYTPIIKSNRLVAKALADAGLKGSAENINTQTERQYAGRQPGLTSWFSRAPRPARAAMGAAKFGRRRLQASTLQFNPAWTLTIQPASLASTAQRYGYKNLAKGMIAGLNPDFRRYVFTKLRGGVEKVSGRDVSQQDTEVGSDAHATGKPLPRTKKQWVDYALESSGREMEKYLYASSVGAAFYHGRDRGLEGNLLKLWMEYGGSKTQSDYYRGGRVGIQQSGEFTTAVPFFTWTADLVNSQFETVIAPAYHTATGKVKSSGLPGHYREFQGKTRAESAALALQRTIRFVLFMYMWEETMSYPLGGRRVFRDTIFGKEPSAAMPFQMTYEIGKAVHKAFKYDSVEPLARVMYRYFGKVGAPATRLYDYLKAVWNDGDVMRYEKRGGQIIERPVFNIYDEPDKDELGYSRFQRATGLTGIVPRGVQAPIFGPYATPPGREAVHGMRESLGEQIIFEMLENIKGPSEEESGRGKSGSGGGRSSR